ncbi:MAG: PP2C family protein-serine/threonine phosphatase [Nocardioides sp.]
MTHDTASSLSESASAAAGDDTHNEDVLRGQVVERGLDQLLHLSHVSSPDELPGLVADAAAVFDGKDAVIYLADLQQRVLVPFQPLGGPSHEEFPQALGIDSTVAGRAFQQMQRLTQSVASEREGGPVRVWLPLLNGTERLGVLGLTLPTTTLDHAPTMRRVQRFVSVVAELVMTKTLYGDSIVRVRRTSPMTLAAEIQWSLLPPLTFVNQSVTVAGGLEPAYEVAGDSLDYAVDAGVARFAVFDGMGHGIVSAQLISLVVAAYRNARRAGQSLPDTATHIETAVNDVFRVESFATGLLCELDTTTGWLTWISAGHHEPLLLRDGKLVRALEVEPLLPLGLNDALSQTISTAVGTEQLQPGDMLLVYTDGVTEARSPDGEFFGLTRLVDIVTRNLAAGLPAPETMRRVVHALLDHQAGDLDDDATLLLVEWHGAPGTHNDPPFPSLTGERALCPE